MNIKIQSHKQRLEIAKLNARIAEELLKRLTQGVK